MAWISRAGPLTQAEMENNADIVISYFRALNINDNTIAGILANLQAESGINPEREEVGGQGYGLAQWTPLSKLQNHCNTLGLSPYNDGDVQLQVLLAEILNQAGVGSWYTSQAFIENYYNSGASPDMIGITGRQFLDNEMDWPPDKLAIMFMAGYERPSYDPNVNHYTTRMQNAINWYIYMGNNPPIKITKRNKYKFYLFSKKLLFKKFYFRK